MDNVVTVLSTGTITDYVVAILLIGCYVAYLLVGTIVLDVIRVAMDRKGWQWASDTFVQYIFRLAIWPITVAVYWANLYTSRWTNGEK